VHESEISYFCTDECIDGSSSGDLACCLIFGSIEGTFISIDLKLSLD
jgi:hypothetical protein